MWEHDTREILSICTAEQAFHAYRKVEKVSRSKFHYVASPVLYDFISQASISLRFRNATPEFLRTDLPKLFGPGRGWNDE